MTGIARLLRLAAFCLTPLISAAGWASELTVFAAASLKEALDEVAADYTEETGIEITLSYAGSSALARQISFGAPADLFISANEAWMDQLSKEGAIQPSSRIDLLRNSLVLIAHISDTDPIDLDQRAEVIARLEREKIALALVDAVPAGIYGKAALTDLGLWAELEPNVVQTDNVRAALALVALRATRFGIVYATDVQAEPRVQTKAVFAAGSHPEILYPAALTQTAQMPQAQAFLDYLQSERADDVFTGYGFMLPDE